jgi:predicted ester cyclase
MAQSNVNAVENAVRAFNQRQEASFLGFFDPALHGTITSAFQTSRTALPDIQYTITHSEASGDEVAFTFSGKGTHSGRVGDVVPTGRAIQWQGAGIATVKDGRITQLELREDNLGRLIQLGLVNIAKKFGLGTPSLTGTWVGTEGTSKVTLRLAQTGTSVVGTAQLDGLAPIEVHGSNDYPNVALSGTLTGLAFTYHGSFENSNEVKGTLTVAGLAPHPVSITRA